MNVAFVRGLYNKYNQDLHEDCIYFATDRKIIIVNGVEYGLDTVQAAILEDAVLSVSYVSPATLKFTHKNGIVTTIDLIVASASTNGLMSKEKFNQVDNNTSRIETLEATAVKQRVTAEDKSLVITESTTGTVAKVNIKPDQAVILDTTNGVGLKIASTDKVLTQSTNGLVANVSVSKKTTGLSANVKEQYDIIGKDNNVLGSIPIYKDAALISVERVNQSIKYTYSLADGTQQVVTIDLSDFIIETEYADGLQVIDGIISAKRDSSSESFLTISANGIKLSGVQNAINSAVDSLDVAKIGGDDKIVTSVSETDGKISATVVDKTASNITSTAVTGSTTQVAIAGTNVQTNINNIATALKTEQTSRITNDANTLSSAKTYTDEQLTWIVI